ncbi:UNVERIFIED_CONTAM: hypothetical protein HDU68_002309 [Siphonaria sp. JEL0065]|nr:hypothetical protein HDU68_002309 [Siphonaria sp. JEL0065]
MQHTPNPFELCMSASADGRRVIVSNANANASLKPSSKSTLSSSSLLQLVATQGLTNSGDLGATLCFHDSASFNEKSSLGTARRGIHGVLGTVQVGADIFLGVVLERASLGLVAGKPVHRITLAGFYSLLSSEFDDYDYSVHLSPSSSSSTQDNSAPLSTTSAAAAAFNSVLKGGFQSSGTFRENSSTTAGSNAEDPADELRDRHPCASIIKLFSTGSFYYSVDHGVCFANDE